MTLTRRQLLLSAGALGAIRVPLADTSSTPGLRLGLLQSAQPFIDDHDLTGSRQRAFTALHELLERSLADNPGLHWLAAGAFPLSGAGPFTQSLLAALALDEASPEVLSLSRMAQHFELRLSLGAWWRRRDGAIKPRLLVFEANGSRQALPAPVDQKFAFETGLQLEMATGLSSATNDLAEQCRRLSIFGARIEPACEQFSPPGLTPLFNGGTQLFAPDASLLARAKTHGETCVVAELPV